MDNTLLGVLLSLCGMGQGCDPACWARMFLVPELELAALHGCAVEHVKDDSACVAGMPILNSYDSPLECT